MKEERKHNARETALEVLMQIERANAWSDGSLKRTITKNQLDSRDAALATRLSYGVIQNRILLDYYISCYCTQKAERLEPVIRNILRLGGYQILFMDKIPHRAAVNEAVEMTRKAGRPKATGMVNAVLHKFVANWMNMPALPTGDRGVPFGTIQPSSLAGEAAGGFTGRRGGGSVSAGQQCGGPHHHSDKPAEDNFGRAGERAETKWCHCGETSVAGRLL